MPLVTASTDGNILAAQALYEQGKSTTTVAKTLGISRASAWRLKHAALLEPDLIQHVSKTLADKALLGANAAVDTFLDKAENGELAKESPIALAKAASVLMQSAGAHAALSGAKDTLSSFIDEFGLQSSHTSSKLTITQSVTVQAHAQAPEAVTLEAEVVHEPECKPSSRSRAGRGTIPPGGA